MVFVALAWKHDGKTKTVAKTQKPEEYAEQNANPPII